MIRHRVRQKIISIILIVALLFLQGEGVLRVYADEAPTKAPTQPSEPKPESPTSAPAPTSPPKAEQPMQAPSSPIATSPPAATQTPSYAAAPTTSDFPPETTNGSTGNTSTQSSEGGSSSPTVTPNYSTGTLGRQTGNAAYYQPSPTEGIASSSSSGDDPSNTTTGPYSTNGGILSNTSSSDINSQNNANVSNLLNLTGNTGNNYANFNTLASNVFTGNSSIGLTLINKLNSNFIGAGGVVNFDIYGQQLGDLALNFSTLNGFLSGNPNGSIATSGGALVQNNTTGPGSENTGEQDENSALAVTNNNSANVTNDIKVAATTGNNDASYNTLGATVKTGNANAFANIVNFVNTNILAKKWLIAFVNIFGELAGNIVLPTDGTPSTNEDGSTLVANAGTGPLSTNTANSTTNISSDTQNTNTAQVINNIKTTADSGNNDASTNTFGGDVKSGSSEVAVNENTVANSNASGDTVWVVIVNQLGHWVGHIVGQPWGAMTASSDNLPVTSGNPTLVANSNTGPISDNSATLNTTKDELTTNTNSATLVNNIDVSAVTGNNTAQYNTGAGEIETGDAKASVNAFNMVNTSVKATKFVALFVNIFGSFLGSVVPPDQHTSSNPISSLPQAASPAKTESPLIGGIPSTTSNPGNNTVLSQPSWTSSNMTSTSQDAKEVNSEILLAGAQNNGSNSTNSPKVQTQVAFQRQKTLVLGGSFKRGSFISQVFMKSSEPTGSGILILGGKHEVNTSWLVLIPIAAFIVLIRRRYILGSLRDYVNILMEVII